MDPCRIFAGNASRRLAQSICDKLRVPLGDAEVSRFEDGEVSVKFNENIRGSDVFIVQATGAPAENLMELLVMFDYAKRLGAELALADKRRPKPDAVEIMNIIGDVQAKNVVLFDDVVTTARTLCQAAEAIRAEGARDIYAGVTHGVFSPGALERLEA